MKLGSIYGGMGICAFIFSAGAIDADMPISAVAALIIFAGFMRLAMKEEGYIRKRNKKMSYRRQAM